MSILQIRNSLETAYPDILTPEALAALEALAHFDRARREIMAARVARRSARALNRERIGFLDPSALIARTRIPVQDARDGKFAGSVTGETFDVVSPLDGGHYATVARSGVQDVDAAATAARGRGRLMFDAEDAPARSPPCHSTTSGTSSWR
jgi:malate synthase